MNSIYLVQSNVDSLPPPSSALSANLATNESFVPFPPTDPCSPAAEHCPVTARRVTENIGPSLAETLLSRWKSFQNRLEECRQDCRPESIHELRVAIRRLISQFTLLTQLLPGCGAEKARNLLKCELESLGALRDTHVQQLFLQRQMVRFPDLACLLNRLKREERPLIRQASRNARRLKINKLEKWIGSLVKLFQEQSLNRCPEFVSLVLGCANAAFADVQERWRLIDRSDLRTVHRTRVAFKKFRYIVESIPSELTSLAKNDLRKLARYQRRMGTIQDFEVILECVRSFMKRHDRPGLEAFCRYLRNRRTRAVRSFLKTSDRLFQFWPPRARLSTARPGACDASRNW